MDFSVAFLCMHIPGFIWIHLLRSSLFHAQILFFFLSFHVWEKTRSTCLSVSSLFCLTQWSQIRSDMISLQFVFESSGFSLAMLSAFILSPVLRSEPSSLEPHTESRPSDLLGFSSMALATVHHCYWSVWLLKPYQCKLCKAQPENPSQSRCWVNNSWVSKEKIP